MRAKVEAQGRRLITFAVEADVGFDRPADIERFADALAEQITELAAQFDSGGAGRATGCSSAATRSPLQRRTQPSSRRFESKVVVEAPRDLVWRAITEPDRIACWFGWDYDGLESEIKYIFVDHAGQELPRLLDLDDGDDRQTIELIEDGPRSSGWCGPGRSRERTGATSTRTSGRAG